MKPIPGCDLSLSLSDLPPRPVSLSLCRNTEREARSYTQVGSVGQIGSGVQLGLLNNRNLTACLFHRHLIYNSVVFPCQKAPPHNCSVINRLCHVQQLIGVRTSTDHWSKNNSGLDASQWLLFFLIHFIWSLSGNSCHLTWVRLQLLLFHGV